MRQTSTPRTAMLRLAEDMQWEVESTGRMWQVTNLSAAKGLTYTATSLLCFLTRVAMSPVEIGGEGLTGPEVAALINFRPKHIYNRAKHRWFLDIDGRIAATDEATMYTAYFNEEGS